MRTRRLLSYEALLRCALPDGKLLSPSELIPIAENSGLILEIGAWVREHACGQKASWKGTALESIRLDINLSGTQLLRTAVDEQPLSMLRCFSNAQISFR